VGIGAGPALFFATAAVAAAAMFMAVGALASQLAANRHGANLIGSGVLTGAALRIAGRRDVGAGALAERGAPRSSTRLLGGQAGLTLRLTRPAVLAWAGALAATGLVLGLVTQSAGQSLQTSPTLDRVIARLGATGGGAATYLGFVSLIAAGLLAVAAAGQIAAARTEEAD